jgi:hypothetical protein
MYCPTFNKECDRLDRLISNQEHATELKRICQEEAADFIEANLYGVCPLSHFARITGQAFERTVTIETGGQYA